MTSAATLFQRNKQLYTEEEAKLEKIVADDTFQTTFQNWLDTTIAQLDFQYERCEQQLSELQQCVAVESGSFWCSKTVMEHCNLHMSEKRLLHKEQALPKEHASLPDLIELTMCMKQLKNLSFMTPKQRRFIEQWESELGSVMFEPRELRCITNALKTKLKDDSSSRSVMADLSAFQNTIEDLFPDIDQCEQLLEASIANGEMGLAEDISKRQLDIYEHILRLITEQYPILGSYAAESRKRDRRRRWAIFRLADKDITAVIDGKYRQIEACEEDLLKIRDQLENYNKDDVHQRKRYEADKMESDMFLQMNKEKQQGVWNRVFELFQELQNCGGELATLARQRRKEIDRRLQMEEREAGRRTGHEAFIHAAATHAQKLQDTIDNALAAKDLSLALNDFVLDGCDSIAANYDKQQNALGEMLRLVQLHHFRRFSDYYLSASRYLYRKERRLGDLEEEITQNNMKRELMTDCLDPNAKQFAEANANLMLRRREVAEEVLSIRHRLKRAEEAVKPTLQSFEFAGFEYPDPRELAEKVNLNRWSKMLDYRELMDPAISLTERIMQEEALIVKSLRETMKSGSVKKICSSAPTVRSTAASTASKGRPTRATQSVLSSRVQTMLEKHLPDGAQSAGAAAEANREHVRATTGAHTGAAGASLGCSSAVRSTYPASGNGTSCHASQAPPGSRKIEGMTFRALFKYTARAPDELSFVDGDRIVCVSRATEEGWFKGICNHRSGLFPINYVELVDPHDQ